MFSLLKILPIHNHILRVTNITLEGIFDAPTRTRGMREYICIESVGGDRTVLLPHRVHSSKKHSRYQYSYPNNGQPSLLQVFINSKRGVTVSCQQTAQPVFLFASRSPIYHQAHLATTLPYRILSSRKTVNKSDKHQQIKVIKSHRHIEYYCSGI